MRFPNEKAGYRHARDALLKAEIDLRDRIERVAAMRRKLPLGGALPEDYVFESETGPVRLSQLFNGKDTLVAYSFMYGPAMPSACPMCTAMLDALNGNAGHIGQRVALVVIAKSPLERIRAFARERGWSNLRLLSSANNNYNRDYHGDAADGSQNPILNVFARKNGAVHHTYATEMMFAPPRPGQDARHIDMIWPLWNLFDFTPGGRGKDWYPKLRYEA
jgi:predicted dithiol-disulfide oxidoreductase (DUF899 family)